MTTKLEKDLLKIGMTALVNAGLSSAEAADAFFCATVINAKGEPDPMAYIKPVANLVEEMLGEDEAQ